MKQLQFLYYTRTGQMEQLTKGKHSMARGTEGGIELPVNSRSGVLGRGYQAGSGCSLLAWAVGTEAATRRAYRRSARKSEDPSTGLPRLSFARPK